MPSMANITVKKADGTTDSIFTAITGAAGDNQPARWRADSVGGAVGHRPVASMLTRNNGNGTGRASTTRFQYKVTREVNGASVLIGTIPFELHGVVGDQYTQAEIDEAVAQAMNFFDDPLHVSALKSGFAPT